MVSWKAQTDLGTRVVAYVHDCMQVDEDWSRDIERGFTWWAEEFAQTIWSEHGLFVYETATYRMHAETDLLHGRGRAHAFELSLMDAMHDATLNACVYDRDKDTYKLHCNAYLTNENYGWMAQLFLAASMLQLAEAHQIAHVLAKKLQATPAVSTHPQHGLRNGRHVMLDAIHSIFQPAGAVPSKWLGVAEWKETDYAMERQSVTSTSNHCSKLAATLFWALPTGNGEEQVSTLQISAEEPSALLGSGLLLRLKLPVHMSAERAAHTAMALNELERAEWLRYHFIGSWCVFEGAVAFECFVPNCAYQTDVLMGMGLNMTLRAQWASETFKAWYHQARRKG